MLRRHQPENRNRRSASPEVGRHHAGLPEAQLNLAHAVIYLATAPKSNTTMAGLSRAFNDVRHRQAGAFERERRAVVDADHLEGPGHHSESDPGGRGPVAGN